MKIHVYERAFLVVGAVMMVAFLGALGFATVLMGIHLPGRAGTIDPAAVAETPPFDSPGVRETAPGRYEVVMIARAWSFEPAEIRVPAGSDVTFLATTTDVIHGLHVEDTRVNMMLIPGQISANQYRFDTPGEYRMICHEYCGLGHHVMAGRVIVEAAE
jgi:cytochrome c oxidase subunit 2